jgi:hypothetical protein
MRFLADENVSRLVVERLRTLDSRFRGNDE